MQPEWGSEQDLNLQIICTNIRKMLDMVTYKPALNMITYVDDKLAVVLQWICMNLYIKLQIKWENEIT